MSDKPKKNQYLDLVKSDSRVSEDDLRLLFEKDLEHTSSYWIFAVGALVGILTFALGNVVALGPKALSSDQGVISTVVALVTFTGITLFLYVINWDRVSRLGFKYYLEARDEIRRRKS
jgi:hypothetical protein